MHFDYALDLLVDGNCKTPLENVRQWMWKVHPDVVAQHRIKKIWVAGEYVWTYDWDTVYYKFKNHFYHEYKSNRKH